MKRLMYTIALSLAFVSVTSASRAIASSSSKQLPTGDSPATQHINLVSEVTQVTSPVPRPAEPACKGEAARTTPPIPNNPTHIRNVVWRNMRALCLQQIAQKTVNPQPAGQR